MIYNEKTYRLSQLMGTPISENTSDYYEKSGTIEVNGESYGYIENVIVINSDKDEVLRGISEGMTCRLPKIKTNFESINKSCSRLLRYLTFKMGLDCSHPKYLGSVLKDGTVNSIFLVYTRGSGWDNIGGFVDIPTFVENCSDEDKAILAKGFNNTSLNLNESIMRILNEAEGDDDPDDDDFDLEKQEDEEDDEEENKDDDEEGQEDDNQEGDDNDPGEDDFNLDTGGQDNEGTDEGDSEGEGADDTPEDKEGDDEPEEPSYADQDGRLGGDTGESSDDPDNQGEETTGSDEGGEATGDNEETGQDDAAADSSTETDDEGESGGDSNEDEGSEGEGDGPSQDDFDQGESGGDSTSGDSEDGDAGEDSGEDSDNEGETQDDEGGSSDSEAGDPNIDFETIEILDINSVERCVNSSELFDYYTSLYDKGRQVTKIIPVTSMVIDNDVLTELRDEANRFNDTIRTYISAKFTIKSLEDNINALVLFNKTFNSILNKAIGIASKATKK